MPTQLRTNKNPVRSMPGLLDLPQRLSDYPFQGKIFHCRDGARLHYLDEGQGPVVLLLHGNPTWSYLWRHLILTYRHRFRFIAPDHAGMGLSDRSPHLEYHLEAHIGRTQELMQALSVQNYSLVAHDWGGAIGMGLATLTDLFPEKAVMLNTAAFRDDELPWSINICRTPVLGEWLMRGANGFALPATWMTTVKPLPQETRQGYLAPYHNWDARIGIARFVQDIPMSERHRTWKTFDKIEQQLAKRPLPMLLVWGLADFCFSEHFLKRWQEFYPQAEVVSYHDAGHYVLEDRPEAHAVIARFLAKRETKA